MPLRSTLALLMLFCPPLYSQSAPPSPPSVFHANARIVVLDVVVSGKNDQPLTGLHKQDFLVTEQGRPQTITYFDEHTGNQAPQLNRSPLPPDVFTNVPRMKSTGSLTVLLLDTLNTPVAAQGFVRTQILKYLRRRQPGQRMAIFTLGTQLRLIQNFTEDPALLAAAINSNQNGGAPQNSPLLQANAEKAAEQEEVAALAVYSPDMAANLTQFLADQSSTRSDVRLHMTLDALQALAHYLAGVPGRKNLVWFSGGFPAVIFPDSGLHSPFGAQRDSQQQLLTTNALLAASQIAVYPIAAEGLAADAIYSAGNDARQAQASIIRPRPEDTEERNANHAGMEQIARGTGGKAFYNTNGLVDALDLVATHAANFYTLTYTSNNLALDGRFRRIQVKLTSASGYNLAYRRGYYADNAGNNKTVQATPARPVADPLVPYLRPGLPASTQVSLTLRVVRGALQPAKPKALPVHSAADNRPTQGGDNASLSGPLTRYNVDLMVPASSLQFDNGPDGHHHVSIETAMIVFDGHGKPVNWMFRQLNLNLDAAHFAAAQASGVNLYQEIDAPATAVLLRSGVYDLQAHLAGTLEIPLKAVGPQPLPK